MQLQDDIEVVPPDSEELHRQTECLERNDEQVASHEQSSHSKLSHVTCNSPKDDLNQVVVDDNRVETNRESNEERKSDDSDVFKKLEEFHLEVGESNKNEQDQQAQKDEQISNKVDDLFADANNSLDPKSSDKQRVGDAESNKQVRVLTAAEVRQGFIELFEHVEFAIALKSKSQRTNNLLSILEEA